MIYNILPKQGDLKMKEIISVSKKRKLINLLDSMIEHSRRMAIYAVNDDIGKPEIFHAEQSAYEHIKYAIEDDEYFNELCDIFLK